MRDPGVTKGAYTITPGDNSKALRERGYAPRSLAEGWPETILHERKRMV